MQLLLLAALPVLTKILLFLGVTFVTYEGVEVFFNQLKDLMIDKKETAFAENIGLLQLIGVDTFISMILAAITIRFSMKIIGGALSNMTVKGVA